MQLELAREHGDGWKVPPIPAEVFNVNPTDREWVDRQCTMQSLATFQRVLTLEGTGPTADTATFILASGWNDSPFVAFYERARAAGWTTLAIPCGHDVMLDRPEELASALLDVAAVQPAA